MTSPSQSLFKSALTADFVLRSAAVAMPGILIGILLVGIGASEPMFGDGRWIQLKLVKSYADKVVPESKVGASKHYQRVLGYFFDFPKVCFPGAAQNNFQRTQCSRFLLTYGMAIGLCLAPVVGWAALLFFLLSFRIRLFRQALNVLALKKASGFGNLTDPPEGSRGIFERIFCLKLLCIEVEGGRSQQIYALYPEEFSTPSPGSKLVYYDWGHQLGAKRQFCQVYSPHLRVIGS
jgi:hypothetical protein